MSSWCVVEGVVQPRRRWWGWTANGGWCRIYTRDIVGNAVDLPLPFGGVDRPSPVVVEHPAEPLTCERSPIVNE